MSAFGCDPSVEQGWSPECGEPAPAAGEMALEAEPAPNPIPGPAGGERGREEEEGRSGMRLGEGMPCSGAPPPRPHWELISLPGDVKLARALWPESSC